MSKYKWFLLIVFVVVLIWSGIRPPASQSDWWLENSPIFVGLIFFGIFGKRLQISNLSLTLIVAYLLLPLVTSHYGVTGVPFGNGLGEFLGSTRNMYDRFTHFMFGFLFFYPVHEFVINIKKVENGWSYYVPMETILAFSAIYEIFEWLAAETVNPVLATSFYGSQGDIFDTPKDMAMAAIGTLVAMFIVSLIRKRKQKLS